MRRSWFAAALTAMAVGVVALSVSTGGAAPNDVAITGVWHKARCAAATCGSSDPKLKSGDAAAGIVQIAVQAKSSLGLGWVRIEARPGTGLWYCITQWDTQGSRNFSSRFDWDTYAWTSPETGSGCSEGVAHFHGAPAANDIYALRVLAHEASGIEGASQQFTLRFNNPPKAPQWGNPPVLSGSGESMEARFSWPPNREPDMVEYGVVRTDPRGATTALFVDAFRKGGNPCGRNASGNLECVDDRYGTTSPAGTYRYQLVAYRRSGISAPSCRTKQVACIASPPSSPQTVRVAGTSATTTTPPTATPTVSTTPTEAPPPVVQPSAIVQTPGDPSASPSSIAGADNRPDPGEGSRAFPVGVAASLTILTAALYVRQFLRGARSRA